MKYSFAEPTARAAYPDSPGTKAGSPETAFKAADRIAGIASSHRDMILAALQAEPSGLCSEEIGKRVGLTQYAVRPRISELYRDGKVKRTEDRTKNAGGNSVMIWRARHD
ncbi:MAG: winged helix-turn-helix domain-containing protein [Bradyrhizobium sp.]|nr:winged helix-turn-helix domain-containing protein [Bradyrhizobium sp.]